MYRRPTQLCRLLVSILYKLVSFQLECVYMFAQFTHNKMCLRIIIVYGNRKVSIASDYKCSIFGILNMYRDVSALFHVKSIYNVCVKHRSDRNVYLLKLNYPQTY